MKRTLTWVFLAYLVVLLPGCPFESSTALGAPEAGKIDTALSGYWLWEDPRDNADSFEMLVLPFNDTEYFVELFRRETTPTRLRAYAVQVDGERFFNINALNLSDSSRSFVFARCSLLERNRLRIRFVGKELFSPAAILDTPELKERIRAHLTDPALDDKDSGLLLRRALPEEIEERRH